MPDGTRYSRTLATNLDSEAWLAAERALIDREAWTLPRARQAAREKREAAAASNTVRRWLSGTWPSAGFVHHGQGVPDVAEDAFSPDVR